MGLERVRCDLFFHLHIYLPFYDFNIIFDRPGWRRYGVFRLFVFVCLRRPYATASDKCWIHGPLPVSCCENPDFEPFLPFFLTFSVSFLLNHFLIIPILYWMAWILLVMRSTAITGCFLCMFEWVWFLCMSFFPYDTCFCMFDTIFCFWYIIIWRS